MSLSKPSKRFQRLLDNESISVQRQIVREALVPLLDRVSKSEAEGILLLARKSANRYCELPKIDLGVKKVEVNNLLDDLMRIAKARAENNHEHFNSIMYEAIESVSSWLNDVWTTAYEFKLDFVKMHSCLVFSIGVIDHIQSMKGGCQCIFETIDIPVVIKDRYGHIVKTFEEVGLKNVESAVFWVWREVLVSLLASKDKTCVHLVPDLLIDVDDLVGWEGLERIICGGETYGEYAKRREEKTSLVSAANGGKDVDSDTDPDLDDPDDCLHAEHWSYKLTKRARKLQRLVFDRLHTIFKTSPSTKLFNCLVSMSPDDSSLQDLDETLASIATTSGSSLATALEVYADDEKPDEIATLLKSHYYLLGPQEFQPFEKAVKVLSQESEHHDSALEYSQRELIDTIRTIHHALLPLFDRMDAPAQREALTRIVEMQRGSPGRQEQIERWVEAAATPGPNNPMAFAAMMMGFPVPGLQPLDDTESLFNLALDEQDLAELKEQLCPDLKKRLKGWVEMAEGIRGGRDTLSQVCSELLEIMPCLQAEDLVEEMSGRLIDRPSKQYICEALEYASGFVKKQKRYDRQQALANSPSQPRSSDQGPINHFGEMEELD